MPSDQDRKLFEIRKFSEFLEKCLGRTVLDYQLKPLTKPGDNFGSVMQSVAVEVAGKNKNDDVSFKWFFVCVDYLNCAFLQFQTLHLVCKTTITNPYLVEMFQPDITFVKEAHFYSDIIPALEQFQEESKVPYADRIDAFIRCLGSRISLNTSKCYDLVYIRVRFI